MIYSDLAMTHFTLHLYCTSPSIIQLLWIAFTLIYIVLYCTSLTKLETTNDYNQELLLQDIVFDNNKIFQYFFITENQRWTFICKWSIKSPCLLYNSVSNRLKEQILKVKLKYPFVEKDFFTIHQLHHHGYLNLNLAKCAKTSNYKRFQFNIQAMIAIQHSFLITVHGKYQADLVSLFSPPTQPNACMVMLNYKTTVSLSTWWSIKPYLASANFISLLCQ